VPRCVLLASSATRAGVELPRTERPLTRMRQRDRNLEPFWSPAAATDGNDSSSKTARKAHKTAEVVAVDCDRWRFRAIQEFTSRLKDAGVGPPTVRKTLALLQGVLEHAVAWGRLQNNPVKSVRRPAAPRKRAVRALPPSLVEDLRAHAPSMRDATLISVLAYGGLRPGEALALEWGDVGKDTIRVEKALALGQVKDTKNLKHRTVRMLTHLSRDLAEWRIKRGSPGTPTPVFPLGDGRFWTDTAYRNWRKRVYQPLARAAGVDSARPYDLRHSLASLLFAEGQNPAEIAEQLGHSLETLLSTYVHVIEELRGTRRRTAQELIREARIGSGHILVTQADTAPPPR
jgi:integrase